MAGILSKGIKISYKTTSEGTYTEIPNLQQVPDFGGPADKVDVTTLANDNYVYINGIKNFGDLEFTFLYDNSAATSNYRIVRGLEEAGSSVYFQVEFPDSLTTGTGPHHGTQFEFSGQVSTTVVGQAVNSAVQFKMNITLNSEIEVENPA